MSSALNAADARLQVAISVLLDERDSAVAITLALRQLRGARENLAELRGESPQRRVLDQQVEIRRAEDPPITLDIGYDMAPAMSWSTR